MSKRKMPEDQVQGSSCVKKSKVQSTMHRFFQNEAVSSSSQGVPPTTTFSPDSLGIHVYSSEEIQEAKGMEKDFRIFWNAKASELCSDKSVRCKLGDRVAIQGAIHTAWTLHKTTLLQLRSEELTTRVKEVYTSEVEREVKLRTIQKNMDRVINSTATVNVLYAEVENTGAVQIHEAITKELSELRKSQEALTRAMKRRREEIDRTSDELETMIATPPVNLSTEEMFQIVKEIRGESNSLDYHTSDEEATSS